MPRDLSAVAEAKLVADLNDLLQLDFDAIQAYALAIRQIDSAVRKRTLQKYQQDHKRHVTELSRLVRAYGGTPLKLPHLSSGPFKLAMQALGAAGGDKAVLLAFKSNERQPRDKYRRAAAKKGLPRAVAAVLRRAARDEERHYSWAEKELKKLGTSKATRAVQKVAELDHARSADVLEGVGYTAGLVSEMARQGVRGAKKHPIRATAVVAGAAATVAAAAVGAARLRKR